tara:strand:+ start:122 stop:277 length:156 start_codon:yes stop_codon:yes gene_type:complete
VALLVNRTIFYLNDKKRVVKKKCKLMKTKKLLNKKQKLFLKNEKKVCKVLI